MTTGSNNTGVGRLAGNPITSGAQNCFFGSGTGNTTGWNGSKNTFIGQNATPSASLTSSTSCTLLGQGTGITANTLSYATAIGAEATVANSSQIVLGRSTGSDSVCCPVLTVTGPTGVSSVYTDANGNITKTNSDVRLKDNISDLDINNCLTHINELTPKSFT